MEAKNVHENHMARSSGSLALDLGYHPSCPSYSFPVLLCYIQQLFHSNLPGLVVSQGGTPVLFHILLDRFSLKAEPGKRTCMQVIYFGKRA